jgi:porphobilinogen synthase
LCETTLTRNDLVAPLFVDETATKQRPIESMPGQFRYPVDKIAGIAGKMWERGIRAVLLFGVPAHKDDAATSAYDPGGIVQQAVRRIKAAYPGMVVITDVCACEYTSHGHCGIVGGTRGGEKDL